MGKARTMRRPPDESDNESVADGLTLGFVSSSFAGMPDSVRVVYRTVNQRRAHHAHVEYGGLKPADRVKRLPQGNAGSACNQNVRDVQRIVSGVIGGAPLMGGNAARDKDERHLQARSSFICAARRYSGTGNASGSGRKRLLPSKSPSSLLL